MYYVDPNDVMRRFKDYLSDYDEAMITKELAIEELQDALDDADCEYIDKEDD